MEAILKAFEKLEKREERRKEALARIGVQRKSQEGRNPDLKTEDTKSEPAKSEMATSEEHKDQDVSEVKENVDDVPQKVII